MEYIKCILCEKDNTKLFLRENNYTAVKCNSCGLVYVNPRPTIAEIKQIYESNKAVTTNIHSFIKLKEKKLLLAKRDMKYISGFKKTGRILEIGSAAGYFLHTARTYGYDVYGLELNEYFVRYSRNILKLNVQSGVISDCTYPANYFDIIYMRNVLSHLSDPVKELNTINRILKDNGIYIFETANAAELNPSYLQKIVGLGLPEHLFHYSKNTVSQLLNRTDFCLVKKIEYSMHYRHRLYALLGEKIRSTYKELSNDSFNYNTRSSYKQKLFARLDMAILSIGRILPKNNRWLTIIYIAEKA